MGWALALFAVSAGAAVRLAAARGDLWFDEIWSLDLATQAGSLLGVLSTIHHDNNHYLNSWFLLLAGADAPPLALRMLSIAAGLGTLVVAAVRPLRFGRLEAFTTTALLAACFILVQYDSEARGYAPAVFFAVAGFHALDAFLGSRRAGAAALFAACSVLGVLSHLTYVFALAGSAAWALAAWSANRGPRRAGAALAVAFAPAIAVLLLLWIVDLRHLVVGGGPPARLADVARGLSRAVLGLPRGPLELLAAAPILLAAATLARMARRRDPKSAFFVVAIVVAPLAALVLRRPEYLGPRYFVIAVPFFLVLVSLGLSGIARRGRAGRAVHAIALAAFCGASAVPIAGLVRDGRGHYRDAIEYLTSRTPGRDVIVGADHDFRTDVVITYHAARPGGEKRILLAPAEIGSGPAPLWLLRHDFSERPSPPAHVVSPAGPKYFLVARYPYSGLSGWHWLVYRLEGDPAVSPPGRAGGPGAR